jgi:protein SCO1/2
MRLAGLALLALLAVACRVDEQSQHLRRFEVKGVVEDVDREAKQLVVDHEDIPDLMPGMSMNFDVANPALLDGVEPGQKISFTLELRDRSFRITGVRVLEAAPAGAAGSGALARVADVGEPAPEFALTDAHGARVTLASLRGNAVLIDFVYTNCPGPCPILTGIHAAAYRALVPDVRAKVRFVSISLDPARDTPEAMAAYAKARGAAQEGWSFLTGPPAEIDPVLRSYAVGSRPGADGTLEHIVVTYLVDPEGRIARRYLGTDHTPERIAEDLADLSS